MNKRKSRRVGIKDIAAKAGVSIGTIDRVLHNRGEVKEETRKKVMEIVDELEYTPNIFAKSLSSKKTTKIAIVIPDSSDNNPYWLIPVLGINQAMEELLSYNAEIIYEHFDASDEQSFKAVLRQVSDQNPDGVVLNPVFGTAAMEFIREFDLKKISYVFIDINLNEINNLAYFGQDAEQSGRVAARLMELSTPLNGTYLIVKQANRKVFSHHIEARVQGFCNYFGEKATTEKPTILITEVDLLNSNEPSETLSKLFEGNMNIGGIFVPNSRGFKLADYLESVALNGFIVIGYDLISENTEHLKKGNITYLICQKPEEQA
ncbi:MAG: LacI family DNA-binding transcriptional regulator [Salinivirgaceae bacterium]